MLKQAACDFSITSGLLFIFLYIQGHNHHFKQLLYYRYWKNVSIVIGADIDWMEFITDDARYSLAGDDCVYYVYITPNGIGDFTKERAERSASAALCADAEGETIESASKKDGSITVKSVLSQKAIENMAEFGVTSAKFEYVLDAKTRELISLNSDYTYDDGMAFSVVTEVNYDADVPEMLQTILAYENIYLHIYQDTSTNRWMCFCVVRCASPLW